MYCFIFFCIPDQSSKCTRQNYNKKKMQKNKNKNKTKDVWRRGGVRSESGRGQSIYWDLFQLCYRLPTLLQTSNSVTDSQLCYRLPVIKLCNEGILFLCTSTRKRLQNTFAYYKISLILILDTMKYIASLKTRLKTALPHMDCYTHVPARHQKQFWCYSAHLYKGHNSNAVSYTHLTLPTNHRV